ncbi:hypothetical protein AR679_gp012 [Yellowstone lake phycodnavirus 1]|uniref:hypothetical protein n=1 Tax=Yellowstone lake phycodnavirus 1 TaxID=1586713 RepID=UPI0006EB7DEC|nr:hypothetical protein AR679_gp012 [Yellowstone lake phycodnavirus 1]BAT22038.1 hypothetical protein [Yellowstone lake phycodnavirus 1]
MFKRPTIRVRRVSTAAPKPVPQGFPSIVGRLADKMRNPDAPLAHTSPWVPSVDYEFIASRMPSGEHEAYIQKSREWFEEHTPLASRTQVVPSAHDEQYILEALAKYARVHGTPGRPSPKDMANAMRAGGYSEMRVTKYLQWCQKMADTADERQEALDKIFAKYPSASKPDPKPKVKKVIKAVKKRMTNEQSSQDGVGGHD